MDTMMTTDDKLELLDLSGIVLPQILSYLSYDDIAKSRAVCTEFNNIAWRLLNRGFQAAGKLHTAKMKAIKMQLPRRESVRRSHPLSKKCDILSAIDTRLSMLSMAFNRYIDAKLCCFIPGKVIDELFRLLRLLENNEASKSPLRPHDMLQELRDISTMAVEHFDENIIPGLRKKELSLMFPRSLNIFETPSAETFRYDVSASVRIAKRQLFDASRQSMDKLVKECCARMKGGNQPQVSGDERKVKTLNNLVRKQIKTIKQLQTTVSEQAVRLNTNEATISDLKRQFDEFRKYSLPQDSTTLVAPSKRGESLSCAASPDVEFKVPLPKKRKNVQRK